MYTVNPSFVKRAFLCFPVGNFSSRVSTVCLDPLIYDPNTPTDSTVNATVCQVIEAHQICQITCKK